MGSSDDIPGGDLLYLGLVGFDSRLEHVLNYLHVSSVPVFLELDYLPLKTLLPSADVETQEMEFSVRVIDLELDSGKEGDAVTSTRRHCPIESRHGIVIGKCQGGKGPFSRQIDELFRREHSV